MTKQSAGLVLYRINLKDIEVLLVHPGGPFWKNKDAGVWSIPKGEYEINEDAFTVAVRELEEETGNILENKKAIELKPVFTKSKKRISAWAVQENFKQPFISSNNIEINWPPKSGKTLSIPEVDKADYFKLEVAKQKILEYQLPLLNELEIILKEKGIL